MSNINEMIENFKDFAELKVYSEAQYTTIVQLSKKIQDLEIERNNLKSILEQSTPLLQVNTDPKIKDEETICVRQLQILNNESKNRELTYEECKKVEIYTKILVSLRNKDKNKENDAGKKDTDELLRLVEGGKIE